MFVTDDLSCTYALYVCFGLLFDDIQSNASSQHEHGQAAKLKPKSLRNRTTGLDAICRQDITKAELHRKRRPPSKATLPMTAGNDGNRENYKPLVGALASV